MLANAVCIVWYSLTETRECSSTLSSGGQQILSRKHDKNDTDKDCHNRDFDRVMRIRSTLSCSMVSVKLQIKYMRSFRI